MFRGTHIVKMDGKGRLVIPSRFRHMFEKEDGMVVTGHPGKYLLLMFRRKFETLEQQIEQLPENSSRAIYYKQTLVGKADDSITFDSAGRITLIPDLREHAELTAKASVIGMGDHLRIWSKESLDKFIQKQRKADNEQLGQVPDGWEGFRI